MSDDASPAQEYDRRLAHCRQEQTALDRRDGRIANLRLVVFIAGSSAAIAWWAQVLSAVVAIALALGFVVLVILHERVAAARKRLERVVAYYDAGKRRLEHRWQGSGTPGTDLAGDQHLYAGDLDLFGSGSLFELLCTARTRGGEEALAGWLCEGASADTVRARQRAVDDLRPRLDFRRDMTVAGDQMRAELSPEVVTQWGQQPSPWVDAHVRALVAGAWLLPIASLASLLAWALGAWGPWPFVGTLVFTYGVGRITKPPIQRILGAVVRPARELEVLAHLLHRLEQEEFDPALLQDLKRRLSHGEHSAAREIRRLERRFDWQQVSNNQVFAPIGFVLWWNIHFAVAIERWRRQHGQSIGDWLRALGEVEALCSLATYAFEHPEDPFPEVVDAEKPLVMGRDLRHPLLPPASCVPNAVELGSSVRLLLVSGSNMSGKSTYLRTIGINVALALAGAPVRAASLTVSPLRMGATLRIQDSLQRGQSRFFAEISRLRDILEAARQGPLLFLLDEILHGTNSHDRGIGAAAILRGLLELGAVGAATTHDLALSTLADSLEGARNVHFADRFVDGQLVFDYRRRDGVVDHSNAVALMRSIGLRV